jgi:hypothetical protein
VTDNARIVYTPLPDSTPESELDALAAVYAFVLECHASKKAADPTGDPNEVREEDIDPKRSLPEERSIPTSHP